MKRRCLSLFMVTIIVLISVAIGFSATAEGENLIKNGNFAETSNNLPTNWKANLRNNTTAEVVKNVSIAAGLNTTAMKFTTTTTSTARSEFYYTNKVKIEKNTTYTTTFWVKSSTISGLRIYMYEPTYIDKSGAQKTSATAIEGQNTYTYSYNSGSTRVIRTDINHSWKIKNTGTVIDPAAISSSMVILRKNGVAKLPAVDYPNETRAGEWVQIEHTFKTGNDPSHEAEIAYSFAFPSVENGNIWFADVVMTAKKDTVAATFTPTVNDPTLGTVSPSGTIELIKGTSTTITAEPFGENTFDGWYLDGVCVSTDPILTFTYNGGVVPQYEARFTKVECDIDGSYENSEPQKVANVAFSNTNEWTEDTFKLSSIDNIHYIDSAYGGSYRTATISKTTPHTGEYSLECSLPYAYYGRKFTNLNKNSNYEITFYAYTTAQSGSASTCNVTVTEADYGVIKAGSYNLTNKTAGDTGVLYYNSTRYNTLNTWTKITTNFNTGDNTEVIVWAFFESSNGKQFLDNFSVKNLPDLFKPASNNKGLGTVSPSTDIECINGNSVTVTATPYPYADFKGWYIGDELISQTPTFTFNYSKNYQGLTAIFEANAKYDPNYNFESYEDGRILASYNYKANPQFNNTPPWSVDTIYRSSDVALELSVTNTLAHWGEKSLCANIPYRYVGLDVENLKPNAKYTISFYAQITGEQYPSSSMDQNSHSISNAFILPKGKEVITATSTSNGLTYNVISAKERLASIPKSVECLNQWKKVELSFTTTDLTDITLWLTFSGYQAVLYMDDFEIYESAEISIKAKRGGSVTPNYIHENTPVGKAVTAKAIPYEGNKFIGWYNEKGKLISTSAEYKFTVTEGVSISALFDGKNLPAEDMFAKEGFDGGFETGTVDGWYFYDPNFSVEWCSAQKTTNEAYEGSSSFAFNSRYRVTVLPLNNLYAHTNYTLSFYVKFNPSDSAALINYFAVLPQNAVTPDSAEEIFSIKTNVTPGEEWQKIELNFNSRNYTSMNFVLNYKHDIGSEAEYLFIDNLALTCKEYTGSNANLYFTPGNVSGDLNGSVNLSDLVTIAQYVAGWKDVLVDSRTLDLNGDSLVNLEDVVCLSRYLAGWDGAILSSSPYIPPSN